ncbi:MAG: hypothetical protein CMO74_03410 [Verrucomicrobiales bacterium]|nr:hypothetical protein [Verrucomicrobiales bacterium]
MTTRRSFIRQMGAASVVAVGAQPPALFARAAEVAPPVDPDGRILVLVQLAGGNDGLNTVAPFDNDAYRRLRPSLALNRNAVHKLNDQLGLHPGMAGFKELFDDGALGIVQGVGYPNPNRSHFRSTDIWHTARPDNEDKRDGWLGRAFNVTAARRGGRTPAIALGTGRLPLALVSTRVTIPTVQSLKDYQLQLGQDSSTNQRKRAKLIRELAETPTPAESELAFLRRTAVTALDTAERLKTVTDNYRPATSYPLNGLGQRLKTVAQLIQAGLEAQVYYVSLGGFDTHADQEAAHTALVTEVSSALHAFHRDLKAHGLGRRVLAATFSEFGRRVKENGSLGTDHGAASQMFLIGDAIRGGLHGAHPNLDKLDQGDLIHHTDFRRVYATLLEKWLGWPAKPALVGNFEPLDVI